MKHLIFLLLLILTSCATKKLKIAPWLEGNPEVHPMDGITISFPDELDSVYTVTEIPKVIMGVESNGIGTFLSLPDSVLHIYKVDSLTGIRTVFHDDWDGKPNWRAARSVKISKRQRRIDLRLNRIYLKTEK
jgi:hypothetical protein